ncbi:MAG: acyl-CoA thioesterase [Pyrinomonadaceae bacterium]
MTPELQKRPLEIELSFKVRSYDIDFAGILSNIVYIRWLEDLRLEFFERYLNMADLLEKKQAPVLVSTHIDYRQTVTFRDRVTGHLWVEKLGHKSMLFKAEFRVGNRLVAEAIQTNVFIDMKTMKAIALPARIVLSTEC